MYKQIRPHIPLCNFHICLPSKKYLQEEGQFYIYTRFPEKNV